MKASRPSKPPAANDASVAAILPVVERLIATVEAENREISSRATVDYRVHTQRKNQGLFELTRLQTNMSVTRTHPLVEAAFRDLASRLELNRRLLSAQLRAARTVADIVARAIRDGQSDGTYSAYPWRDDPR